jgi:hypothetical protein
MSCRRLLADIRIVSAAVQQRIHDIFLSHRVLGELLFQPQEQAGAAGVGSSRCSSILSDTDRIIR